MTLLFFILDEGVVAAINTNAGLDNYSIDNCDVIVTDNELQKEAEQVIHRFRDLKKNNNFSKNFQNILG